jgi:hypothetical protein
MINKHIIRRVQILSYTIQGLTNKQFRIRLDSGTGLCRSTSVKVGDGNLSFEALAMPTTSSKQTSVSEKQKKILHTQGSML